MSRYRRGPLMPPARLVGAPKRAGHGLAGRKAARSGQPPGGLQGGWRKCLQRHRSRAPPQRVRRKVQPDTEGIETASPVRAEDQALLCRKVQPDTEGIETWSIWAAPFWASDVAKSSPIPRA